MQPATASPGVSAKSCPSGGALAWPIQREPVRFSPRGAKHRAAGMGPCADPLEASKARSAAGAKAGGIDAEWP